MDVLAVLGQALVVLRVLVVLIPAPAWWRARAMRVIRAAGRRVDLAAGILRPRTAASLLALVPLLAACGAAQPMRANTPPSTPATHEPLISVPIPAMQGHTAVHTAMVVDPEAHLLYVADGTDPAHPGVDVVDLGSAPGRYVRTIPTTGGVPGGLALAPDLHRLYTANSDGSISVIDTDPSSPTDQTAIAVITTAGHSGGAGLLAYDPHERRLFVSFPADEALIALDVNGGSIAWRIGTLGLVEQPVYDPADGMVYVGEAGGNQLLRIDPHTDRVVAHLHLGQPCEPDGIAVNPITDQALIGCASRTRPLAVVYDLAGGRRLRSVDLPGGGDQVTYDGTANRFYVAASLVAGAQTAIFSGSPIDLLTVVPSGGPTHDVADDAVHHLVYTVDGRANQAGLWAFPDPTTR